jgi:hypothetical protein
LDFPELFFLQVNLITHLSLVIWANKITIVSWVVSLI